MSSVDQFKKDITVSNKPTHSYLKIKIITNDKDILDKLNENILKEEIRSEMIKLYGSIGGSADFEVIHHSFEENSLIIRTPLFAKTLVWSAVTMVTSILEKPCRFDVIKSSTILASLANNDKIFDVNEFLEAI